MNIGFSRFWYFCLKMKESSLQQVCHFGTIPLVIYYLLLVTILLLCKNSSFASLWICKMGENKICENKRCSKIDNFLGNKNKKRYAL